MPTVHLKINGEPNCRHGIAFFSTRKFNGFIDRTKNLPCLTRRNYIVIITTLSTAKAKAAPDD
jgi:hypothetical protein